MPTQVQDRTLAPIDQDPAMPAQAGRLYPSLVNPARDLTLTYVEFVGAISQAYAAALDAVSAELRSPPGAGVGLVHGIAEGNARFFEVLARAARRSAEDLRAGTRESSMASLDYDRLATLVAEKLRSVPK